MRFAILPPRGFRRWDSYGSEAAVAAALIMAGGKLLEGFNRSTFDRRIGRRYKAPLDNLAWIDYAATLFPKMRISEIGPIGFNTMHSEEQIVAHLEKQGWNNRRIRNYLRSPDYQRACSRQRSLNEIRKKHHKRWSRIIGPGADNRAREALARETALITASAKDENDWLLILPTGRRGGMDVHVFSGKSGLSSGNVDTLTDRGILDLAGNGFFGFQLRS